MLSRSHSRRQNFHLWNKKPGYFLSNILCIHRVLNDHRAGGGEESVAVFSFENFPHHVEAGGWSIAPFAPVIYGRRNPLGILR